MRRLLTLDAVLEAEDGRCAVEGNDLIFHKIWLTDQGSLTEVPDDLMAHFRASMALQDETAVCYFGAKIQLKFLPQWPLLRISHALFR
ncbi:MAG: hypothetical protein H6925_03515 [Holosporaceae bacterium]|nr:MAG: hypothetical protein H6925_03515 [Holosporaceae bacterium]